MILLSFYLEIQLIYKKYCEKPINLFHLDITLKVIEYMDFSHILHCKYFLILTKI